MRKVYDNEMMAVDAGKLCFGTPPEAYLSSGYTKCYGFFRKDILARNFELGFCEFQGDLCFNFILGNYAENKVMCISIDFDNKHIYSQNMNLIAGLLKTILHYN